MTWGGIGTWGEPATWDGVSGGGPSPGLSATAGPGRRRRGREMLVAWTIDGAPVRLTDWTAGVTDRGGFDQARGFIPAGTPAFQGSRLVGYRADGTVLWEGAITLTPKVAKGQAEVAAQGDAYELERAEMPMLYRDDDTRGWEQSDSDPYGQTTHNAFETVIGKGQVRFRVAKNESLSNGNHTGVVRWYEGCEPSKLTCDRDNDTAMPNYDLTTSDSVGPTGALTVRDTETLTATSGTVSANLTGDDLITVKLSATSSITSALERLVLTNLKVYGRTRADEFVASDVIADLCNEVGFDTERVQGSDDDVLPLYWTDGSLADLADYMADLTDWRWRIVDGRRMDFGPYETHTWTGYRERGILDLDLTPAEIFHGVRCSFTSVSGAKRTLTRYGDQTELPAVPNIYELDLEDPQPNNDLAAAVSQRIANRLILPRMVGRGAAYEVYDAHGQVHAAHDIQGGDALVLPDALQAPGPHRLASVSYGAGQCQFEMSNDLDVARLLAKAEKFFRRRRKRHR